ncbi:MAG: hypothetical protein ACW99U_04070 [Candidatus Thorarchaeota archaeon]|jgi:chromosome segregation ATPase
MPSDDTDTTVAKLEKKVDKLSDAMSSIATEIKALSTLPEISKAVGTLSDDLKKVKKQLGPVAKVAEIVTSVEGLVASISELKESQGIFDELKESVAGLGTGLEGLKQSSNIEEHDKKADELSASVAALHSAFKTSIEQDEPQLLVKKIDELQQYVADLSGLEEKISELSGSFDETREIVSIIVRQLDDIERKYNKALEEVSKALEEMTKRAEKSPKAEPPPKKVKPKKETPKKEEAKEPEPLGVEGLPADVDELMDRLLKMVSAQTEAKKMASELEVTRDKLTTLIEEHTPVIYQFGKRARELKSYPPTATLNENDIARLNKEIREWKIKLLEVTRPG